MVGQWVIIVRFGIKYGLVHFRWSYVEVDLDDMRSANRLFEILGRDGELQLHLPSTKFPIHYLVGSQTLIFLSGMGNGILKSAPNGVGHIRTIAWQLRHSTNRPLTGKLLLMRWEGGKRLMISWVAYGTWGGLKHEKDCNMPFWNWNWNRQSLGIECAVIRRKIQKSPVF